MIRVHVRPVEGRDLYLHYSGMDHVQPCYILLHCRSGLFTAEVSRTVGSGMPMEVYQGHVQRWAIPTLQAGAANALLERLAPLMQGILEGYGTRMNGCNRVADFTPDAYTIIDVVEQICEEIGEEGRIQVWDATDWYAGIGSLTKQAKKLGVRAKMRETEIQILADDLESEIQDEGVIVRGIESHLRHLRQHMRTTVIENRI